MPIAAQSLCHAFQRTAAARPDAVALRTPGGAVEITWGDYAARVRRIAAGLAALGVGRGDTVGLMTVNRPEFHLCDTAAMHLGAAAGPGRAVPRGAGGAAHRLGRGAAGLGEAQGRAGGGFRPRARRAAPCRGRLGA